MLAGNLLSYIELSQQKQSITERILYERNTLNLIMVVISMDGINREVVFKSLTGMPVQHKNVQWVVFFSTVFMYSQVFLLERLLALYHHLNTIRLRHIFFFMQNPNECKAENVPIKCTEANTFEIFLSAQQSFYLNERIL